MCLHRNVMIVCGVIHPGHPMFFTVNCNIDQWLALLKSSKWAFPLKGIHLPLRIDNYIQRGLFNEFLEDLVGNNWFYGPLLAILINLGGIKMFLYIATGSLIA